MFYALYFQHQTPWHGAPPITRCLSSGVSPGPNIIVADGYEGAVSVVDDWYQHVAPT